MLTIEEMQLAPIMKFRATQLLAKFPTVTFTSGRRGKGAQARAMAINQLQDDTYLLRTYRNGADFLEAIARLPVSSQRKVLDVAGAIEGLMTAQPHLLTWAHRDGNAVDILPMEDAMGQPTAEGARVLAWIRACEDTKVILTREGKLVRWHWECRADERSEEV